MSSPVREPQTTTTTITTTSTTRYYLTPHPTITSRHYHSSTNDQRPTTNHFQKKSPTHKHNHTKNYNPTIPPATTPPNTTATKTLSQTIIAEKSPCCLCAPLPCCCPLLPPSVAEALDPLSFVLVAVPVRVVVFVSGIIVVVAAAVVVKRVSLAVKIPVKISLLGRLEKLVRAAYVEHRGLLRRVGWGLSLSLWFSCSCWFSRGGQTTIWSGFGLGVSMGMGGRVVCAYSCCCCSCCCWARTLAVRRCNPREVARSCGIMGVIVFSSFLILWLWLEKCCFCLRVLAGGGDI